MIHLKCTIAYNGSRYFGFQKNDEEKPTIEGELTSALKKVLQHDIEIQGASRTDRGVHATGQVVQFQSPETDLYALQGSLRRLLPEDIALLSIEETHASFHPSLDATGKRYRYQIYTRDHLFPFDRDFAWYSLHPLDIEAMREASLAFLGTHDFTAFTSEPALEPICTLNQLDIHLDQNKLTLTIEGDRFLYKMVRSIVGTLYNVGAQKIPPCAIEEILLSKDRRRAGVTAPPQGLYLDKVFY